MRKNGKILTAFLAVLLLLSLFSVTAFADTTLTTTIPCTVTLQVGDHGKVTVDGTDYTGNASFQRDAGTVLTYTFSPNGLYSVDKVIYNGTEVKSELSGNTWIAPALTGNAALSVSFKLIGGGKPTYTVSFNANGHGTAPASQTVLSGYTAFKPADPTVSGWKFGGWYKEAACTNAFDFTTPITGNITLYAKWTEDGTTPTPTSYTVSFDANGGSVTPASAVTGADGKLASLPTPARSGSYSFKGWYTAASGGTKVTTSTVFTTNTTIYAQWTYTGGSGGIVIPTVFPVTVKDSDNGDVTASSKYAAPGTTVKLTVTPNEGYELDTLIVKSGSKFIDVTEKNGKYQFVMPFGSATVTATFKAVNPYNDVDTDDWFYDDVLYVTLKDLMNGTGNGKFSPEITTDRAMLVTVLWRLEGCPVVDSSVDFDDVADGLWYSDAIDWASANGIVNGYGDGKFGPTDQITREQIAAILNRYAAYKGWTDGIALPMLAQYKCSEWAEDNVIWAENNGLLDGLGVDVSDMTAKASRAELAAYLAKFYKEFAEN